MLGYTAYDRQLRSQVQMWALLVPWHGTVFAQPWPSGSKRPTSGSRRKNASHHLASSCLNFLCLLLYVFRKFQEYEYAQEKERNILYITSASRHQVTQPQGLHISPPNVPVQVEMQRQATEEMKQKVGMEWENIYEMNRDEYIRYIECLKFKPKVHLTNTLKTFGFLHAKEQQLETPSMTGHFGSYQEISKDIERYQGILIKRLPGPLVIWSLFLQISDLHASYVHRFKRHHWSVQRPRYWKQTLIGGPSGSVRLICHTGLALRQVKIVNVEADAAAVNITRKATEPRRADVLSCLLQNLEILELATIFF